MTAGGHRFECRVYFEDTDAGGVVYNANYLRFYERARTELLRKMGFEQDELMREGIVFVVRNMNIDFVQAARFNEMLEVVTRVNKLKKVSVDLDQEIFTERAGQTELINRAEVKIACVNSVSFKPCAMPESIYREFSAYE